MSEYTKQNERDSEIYTDGYNDGYDACKVDMKKYRWHDLRKNPEDLPKEGKQVYVYGINYHHAIAKYDSFRVDGGYKKTWALFDAFNIIHELNNVIAWREIEPLEEEE